MKNKFHYANANPIAVQAITNNCAMCIMDTDGDNVIVKGYTGDMHQYKLHHTEKGSWFRYQNGCRYYVNDFMKV